LLSAWIGNVSYAVVMFSALSYFFPLRPRQHLAGNSRCLRRCSGSFMRLILSGVRQAAFVTLITTIAKIAPIVLFIAVAIVAFKIDIFSWPNRYRVRQFATLIPLAYQNRAPIQILLGVRGNICSTR
jgi:amino acid transporter